MLAHQRTTRTYRAGHVCCSIGAGAAGFADAAATIGSVDARFECAGGVDVDPLRIANFERMTGVKGTVLDLMSREQYAAYHGRLPPEDWREATPQDLRDAFGGDVDVVFSSPPCRGLTSLLDPSLAPSDRYQALNQLTVRSVMLTLEAFRDSLRIFLLENVPGLGGPKGRRLLNQITAVLRAAGFSVTTDVHDCGEVGGLAQHRRRFLLVARHMDRVPPFLYRPRKRAMRTLGEVIGALPLPGDPIAGPMHRIPALAWKTWKRLAFVEPGRDWKSLSDLRVVDGMLADWGIAPLDGGAAAEVGDPRLRRSAHNQVLGVKRWSGPAGTVTGASRPLNGAFAVADPTYARQDRRSTLGVRAKDDVCGAVTGNTHPSNGAFSVADDRGALADMPTYAIVPMSAGAAVGAVAPTGTRGGRGKYRVTGMDEQSGTVIASSTTGEGAYAVADPTGWSGVAGACALPPDDKNLVARIVARDGTWHRPFTALELAALQSLVPEGPMTRPFTLLGSETAQRLFIGDAVPRAAARGMAETILGCLLAADLGHRFELSTEEIWAKPLATALSVDLTAPGGAIALEAACGG